MLIDEVIKILDDLSKRFRVAIDWSSQNIMPYLKDLMDRYVKYNIGANAMVLCLGIISAFIVFVIIKKVKETDYLEEPIVTITSVCIILLSIFSIVSVPTCIINIIRDITIPEKLFFDLIRSISG